MTFNDIQAVTVLVSVIVSIFRTTVQQLTRFQLTQSCRVISLHAIADCFVRLVYRCGSGFEFIRQFETLCYTISGCYITH